LTRPDRDDLLRRIQPGPVAVIAGGWSREREVSLRSGRRVFASLKRQGFPVVLIDADRALAHTLQQHRPTVAVLMLHGSPGEDGTIQGLLDVLGIPYTGSGVTASAVGMDKWLTKRLFQAEDLPTPPALLVRTGDLRPTLPERVAVEVGFPVMLKPRREGSSFGVVPVDHPDALLPTLQPLVEEFGDMLVETYIQGREITVGVLGTGAGAFALPILELRPRTRRFYDYEAKYTPGATEFLLPAPLSDTLTRRIQDLAVRAHRLLGCRGMSRVDGMVRGEEVFLLEVNTIPGMTETSDLPAQAEEAGISYDDLVLWILQSAFE